MIKLNTNGLGLNKDSKEFKLLNELIELLNYKGYCGNLDLNINKIEKNVGNTLVERWNYWKPDPEKRFDHVPDSLRHHKLVEKLPDNELRNLVSYEYSNFNDRFDLIYILNDKILGFIENCYLWFNQDGKRILGEDEDSLDTEAINALIDLDFNNLDEGMFEKFKSKCPYQLFKDLVELMNYLIKYCPHYYEN